MARPGTIAITDFDWYSYLSQQRSWDEALEANHNTTRPSFRVISGLRSRETGLNRIFALIFVQLLAALAQFVRMVLLAPHESSSP